VINSFNDSMTLLSLANPAAIRTLFYLVKLLMDKMFFLHQPVIDSLEIFSTEQFMPSHVDQYQDRLSVPSTAT
jgi:hypothetical protein